MGFLAGLIGLALMVLMIMGAWRGLQKAGFSGAWALLLIVPVLNLVMLWVFAFISWPVDDPARKAITRQS